MYTKNGKQCQITKPETPFPERKDYNNKHKHQRVSCKHQRVSYLGPYHI